jgi:hypothetical protein
LIHIHTYIYLYDTSFQILLLPYLSQLYSLLINSFFNEIDLFNFDLILSNFILYLHSQSILNQFDHSAQIIISSIWKAIEDNDWPIQSMLTGFQILTSISRYHAIIHTINETTITDFIKQLCVYIYTYNKKEKQDKKSIVRFKI